MKAWGQLWLQAPTSSPSPLSVPTVGSQGLGQGPPGLPSFQAPSSKSLDAGSCFSPKRGELKFTMPMSSNHLIDRFLINILSVLRTVPAKGVAENKTCLEKGRMDI